MKFGVKQLVALAIAGFMASGVNAALTEKDYREIKPAQATEEGPKVEVIEFFWYGCPHCYELEPTLKKWLARKPDDVSFRRVPAIFRQSWVPGAQTFYTLETMGELDRLHAKVFDAIHIERQPFSDMAAISAGWARTGSMRRSSKIRRSRSQCPARCSARSR
jgi:thiol:disulfide interchange protein DsbA